MYVKDERHGKTSMVRVGKKTFLLSFSALLGKIKCAKGIMWFPERGRGILN